MKKYITSFFQSEINSLSIMRLLIFVLILSTVFHIIWNTVCKIPIDWAAISAFILAILASKVAQKYVETNDTRNTIEDINNLKQ